MAPSRKRGFDRATVRRGGGGQVITGPIRPLLRRGKEKNSLRGGGKMVTNLAGGGLSWVS